MNKVLIIQANPSKKSFCYYLTEEYRKGVIQDGKTVEQLNLGDLKFEPFLRDGFSNMPELEPDIIHAQELITWADHITFVYPIWWATGPSILKAFIERTFLPGFAFKYKESKTMVKWDKYLIGKTSRIISTMDTPPFFYKWLLRDPNHKMMKNNLTFCGIKSPKKTYFGSIKTSTATQREKWLKEAYSIGYKE